MIYPLWLPTSPTPCRFDATIQALRQATIPSGWGFWFSGLQQDPADQRSRSRDKQKYQNHPPRGGAGSYGTSVLASCVLFTSYIPPPSFATSCPSLSRFSQLASSPMKGLKRKSRHVAEHTCGDVFYWSQAACFSSHHCEYLPHRCRWYWRWWRLCPIRFGPPTPLLSLYWSCLGRQDCSTYWAHDHCSRRTR